MYAIPVTPATPLRV